MTHWRPASRKDVSAIVALLRDDVLGATREVMELSVYLSAFDAMASEPHNRIFVGEIDGRIVATYQLTFISGLSLTALRRALVEGVRVASDLRGQGIGERLMMDAEARARAAGCSLIQLTSTNSRTDAHRFYLRQGYVASHTGFKKTL